MKLFDDSSSKTNQEINARVFVNSGPLKGVNICVIGGGFVGLSAAAGFSQFGHSVVCVENDARRLKQLQEGKVPFFEPELEELLVRSIESKRLTFSGDLAQAVKGQKAIFVTVGTPTGVDGRTDLGALEDVILALSEVIEPDQVVVLKSTVPVGTGKLIESMLCQNGRKKTPFAVINNPEFLREGSAVYDFFKPQRIVVGGKNQEAVDLIVNIYKLGMSQPVPFFITNNETAEMIKYASNAFLAAKVGYVNELAGLCDHLGVNVLEVARAMGLDPRIGSEFLEPGPGWGGSCFHKDLKEFSGLAETKGYPLLITEAVLASNRRQHNLVVEKIKKLVGTLKGAKIGVLGLAFKANTSDIRESPAIAVVQKLVAQGAKVTAYDPKAMEFARELLPQVVFAGSPYETVKDSDCLVILTEWREFQLLDFKLVSETMRRPNIVDARNLLTPEQLTRYGFNYSGMGQT